ncbi:MAG TPA: hypothetical protein VLN57_07730 [Xanthobacteraceae bacterium]|nr:hypothetical protein [Xanthobacteraceae bacterium]
MEANNVNTPSRKLTRRELAPFLAEHGYPISINGLNRICGPAVDRGPPVAGRWGTRDLYDPAECLAWAEQRAGIKKSGVPSGAQADVTRLLQEALTAKSVFDIREVCGRVVDLTATLPAQTSEHVREQVVDVIRERIGDMVQKFFTQHHGL